MKILHRLKLIVPWLFVGVICSCSTGKSTKREYAPTPSLEGVPTSFDGVWSGTCNGASYGQANYSGAAELTVKQTPESIDIRGACYKQKPIGSYFGTGKLLIKGNDLVLEKTGVNKGRIGNNGIAFKSTLVQPDAPGMAVDSVLTIDLKSPGQVMFIYYQEGVNTTTGARTRAETITGDVVK